MSRPDHKIGHHGRQPTDPDGLYRCTADCPQGAVHDDTGCEACHDPDAPYIIKFKTWESAYCGRCARQMRSEGHRPSPRGRALPDDQLALFSNADIGEPTRKEPGDDEQD